MNLETLRDELIEHLDDALTGLIDGAAQDIEAYVTLIANDAVRAMTIEDEEVRDMVFDSLKDQTLLIPELTRLRAVNESWELVHKTVVAVLKITATAVMAAA